MGSPHRVAKVQRALVFEQPDESQLRQLGKLWTAGDRQRGAPADEFRRQRQEQIVGQPLAQQAAENGRAALAQERADIVMRAQPPEHGRERELARIDYDELYLRGQLRYL